MPKWTIIPPTMEDLDQYYCHPMIVKLFRIMKTIYGLLDPQNEPSGIHEGKHTASFGYEDSEETRESSVLSSLFIHFGLSSQTSPRFAIISPSMQIEDLTQGSRIPVPPELVPTVKDICDFAVVRSQFTPDPNDPAYDIYESGYEIDEPESYPAGQVWERVQMQKFHELLLKADLIESTDPRHSHRCDLCRSDLLQCKVCLKVMCPTRNCSAFPLSCMRWRPCAAGHRCWYSDICVDCVVGGTTCLCEETWTCDLCTEKGGFFLRCLRCDRPFCDGCSYLVGCRGCRASNLCHDCAEEAPENVAKEDYVELVGPCTKCKTPVCKPCATAAAAGTYVHIAVVSFSTGCDCIKSYK
ncbi:hypothetical protein BD769DRAFT_1432899 [Suillus cothurnatus]|nr:hypothetical protein BD769DRAFT_893217 [Suillus cothurnatus]KAG2138786.1 hypothetical protein BD769DRAFT_1432899 [Suillus cothurnatus]